MQCPYQESVGALRQSRSGDFDSSGVILSWEASVPIIALQEETEVGDVSDDKDGGTVPCLCDFGERMERKGVSIAY